jgi:hypothetical protein
MSSDGHVDSMHGTLDRIPETRCCAADGSITGVTPRDSAQIV